LVNELGAFRTQMHSISLVDRSLSSPPVVAYPVAENESNNASPPCRHNGAYYVALWNALLLGTEYHIVGSTRPGMQDRVAFEHRTTHDCVAPMRLDQPHIIKALYAKYRAVRIGTPSLSVLDALTDVMSTREDELVALANALTPV
jgi:hypothetical protein